MCVFVWLESSGPQEATREDCAQVPNQTGLANGIVTLRGSTRQSEPEPQLFSGTFNGNHVATPYRDLR